MKAEYRSTALKAIKKIEKHRTFLKKGRVRDNQPGWLLTRQGADELLNIRAQQGFSAANSVRLVEVPAGAPMVYLIGLPDLEELHCWPLTQAFEEVMIAIAHYTTGIRHINGEVFEPANDKARQLLLDRLDELARDVGASALQSGAQAIDEQIKNETTSVLASMAPNSGAK
jgi:hypothetical protein